MAIHAQTLDLIDDPVKIAEYDAHHRRVWPEVLAGLRAVGIRSMRIWRHGTRLFMVMETGPEFDPARYQEYAATPKAREWDALMRSYQRRAPSATGDPATRPAQRSDGDAWWTPMAKVFDLEEASPGADGPLSDSGRLAPARLDAHATPP